MSDNSATSAVRPVEPAGYAFGIFEGGGAKGLAHVGAAKAVEEARLEFVGVAGTSAGALVSSLIAVGYRPDELLNPDDPKNNILNRHGLTPITLLGEAGWARLNRLRAFPLPLLAVALFPGLLTLVPFHFRTTLDVARILKRLGVMSTTTVQEELNALFREKVKEHWTRAGITDPVPRKILFRHIDPRQPGMQHCIQLKIITTDVTHRRIQVFGTTLTPDVEVAEAVAASIAIPVVFEPARITSLHPGGSPAPDAPDAPDAPEVLFADGGLVANLPVWAFEEERQVIERAMAQDGPASPDHPRPTAVPMLAFTLDDPPPPALKAQVSAFARRALDGAERLLGRSRALGAEAAAPSVSLFEYLVGVVRTGIFGGQNLTRDLAQKMFMDDVVLLPLHTSIGVMDFDLTLDQAVAGYREGKDQAAATLEDQIRRPRRVMDRALRLIAARCAVLFREVLGHDPSCVRWSVLLPHGQYALRVMFSLNMEQDADDRLILDRRNEGAPLAFQKKAPTYLAWDHADAGEARLYMTKYEKALVRPALASLIALPLLPDPQDWALDEPQARTTPLGVLVVDSDEPLQACFLDQAVMRALAICAIAVARLVDKKGGSNVE